jgi:hypothetical protein
MLQVSHLTPKISVFKIGNSKMMNILIIIHLIICNCHLGVNFIVDKVTLCN